MFVYAIIVGAGKGRRFGGLKQFVNFSGKPLLIHTTEILAKSTLVDRIIVVVPKGLVKKTGNLLKYYGVKKIYAVIAGGRRRQDSVLNGIKAIKGKSGILAIHDAVRPFISEKLIDRGVNLCKKYKAVIFGVPIFDTIKLVKRHRVVLTVPRISPFAIQTPQFFDYEYLVSAYKKVNFEKTEFTDEALIVESAGKPVYVFKGEPGNIKITKKSDLKFLVC
ncbi:MAG: 2-C-methyl-D-erythritol 4-phosphate cytidylyltransferase [bacterium]